MQYLYYLLLLRLLPFRENLMLGIADYYHNQKDSSLQNSNCKCKVSPKCNIFLLTCEGPKTQNNHYYHSPNHRITPKFPPNSNTRNRPINRIKRPYKRTQKCYSTHGYFHIRGYSNRVLVRRRLQFSISITRGKKASLEQRHSPKDQTFQQEKPLGWRRSKGHTLKPDAWKKSEKREIESGAAS